MVLFWFIFGTFLWAKGPDCSHLFDGSANISIEADLFAKDVYNKERSIVYGREVISGHLNIAKQALQERKQELITDKSDPMSVYNHIQYDFNKILKTIDQMGLLADRLLAKKDISYEEYFKYFYRLSAVLSFLKTSEVQRIYDNVSDYLGKDDPQYNIYTFSKENFDHFADYALSGQLPMNSEINTVLTSPKARILFIYEMPTLELLSEKMANGVVYGTISTSATSFDGGPITFPFNLAKHDVDHAARFIAALDRESIEIQRFSDDNQKLLSAIKNKVSDKATQLFWSIHFSRNHEGSYDLTYITVEGKYSWLGLSNAEVLSMLALNPPENWRLSEVENVKIIKELRRKGFL